MSETGHTDILSEEAYLRRRILITKYWNRIGRELAAEEATFPAFIKSHDPGNGRYVINGTVSGLLDHLREEALELAEAISVIQADMASDISMVPNSDWDSMLAEHTDILYLSTALMLAWPPGSSWAAEASASIRHKLSASRSTYIRQGR